MKKITIFIPDRGIDVVASFPEYPDIIINIQVKGRNPEKDPNWRWFQIRVSPTQMLHGRVMGIDPDQLLKNKVF